MFKRFFDTTRIDTFAAGVVRELGKSLPPDEIGKGTSNASKRPGQLDQRVARMVADLHRGVTLNIYQKAKLGSRLQDALEAAGYPADFAKSLSYDVVVLVAQVPGRV